MGLTLQIKVEEGKEEYKNRRHRERKSSILKKL
jgi:hypothetical protein